MDFNQTKQDRASEALLVSTHERSPSLEAIEVELLLEGLFRVYGYDFREYSSASLGRRVWARVEGEGLQSVSQLQDRVLRDRGVLDRLLFGLSVHMTAMFRDPLFYRSFRLNIVPILRTYPFVRIWLAGCATGEEVYSVAIVLHEEGLLDRCRIYATDMNDVVLGKARSGIYPLGSMKEFTTNYLASGGLSTFSDYYTAGVDEVIFRSFLRRDVVFAQHNLATDGPFNEFQLIFCRNVMIYFNRELQARVHELFLSSLASLGILALGSKESLSLMPVEPEFKEFDVDHRIYRRIR